MKNAINTIKHSGDIEAFDVEKLIKSLRRSQADEALIQQIVAEIQGELYEGITTKQIYQKAFKMLKSKARVSASRYKLKKAIIELGPSGFPFEKFVGKILDYEDLKPKLASSFKGIVCNMKWMQWPLR